MRSRTRPTCCAVDSVAAASSGSSLQAAPAHAPNDEVPLRAVVRRTRGRASPAAPGAIARGQRPARPRGMPWTAHRTACRVRRHHAGAEHARRPASRCAGRGRARSAARPPRRTARRRRSWRGPRPRSGDGQIAVRARRGRTVDVDHGPPMATTLLPPAETSASVTPSRAQLARHPAQRVALADGCPGSAPRPRDRTAPCAHARPGAGAPHAAGARAAASISAAAGSRPSRRRKPQHRLSGVVVMSKAPPRGFVELAAHARSSAKSSVVHRRPASPAARRLTSHERARLPEHGERRLDAIDLVEGRARRVDVVRRPRRRARPRSGTPWRGGARESSNRRRAPLRGREE